MRVKEGAKRGKGGSEGEELWPPRSVTVNTDTTNTIQHFSTTGTSLPLTYNNTFNLVFTCVREAENHASQLL